MLEEFEKNRAMNESLLMNYSLAYFILINFVNKMYFKLVRNGDDILD